MNRRHDLSYNKILEHEKCNIDAIPNILLTNYYDIFYNLFV